MQDGRVLTTAETSPREAVQTFRSPLPRVSMKRGGRWWRGIPLAAGAYLCCSLLLWSNIWSRHPASVTNATTTDTSAFLWYLEWTAYALSHGHNLFYSSAMLYPTGTNLLVNTGVVALGVVLAPVTWIFGPVVSLNVALTIAPVTSALALFVLLRRWVNWLPAAFIGGFLYGFSPFVLASLTLSQLNLAFLLIPPLIMLCLDELLVRQNGRPVPLGLALGLLVTLQFFIASEVLVITAIVVACCVGLFLLYWLLQRDWKWDRARFSLVGLLTAGGVSALLLSYPVWFTLAGPAHLSGLIWSQPLSYYGNSVAGFVKPVHEPASAVFGGGFGSHFLGIGLPLVCVIGLIIWRKDLRLRFFAVGTSIALLLSLGAGSSRLLPWRFLARLPLLENVIPSRFVIIAYLGFGIMLGLIVDHAYLPVEAGVQQRSPSLDSLNERKSAPHRTTKWIRVASATAVGAIALAPIAGYLATDVPLAVSPIAPPPWFKSAISHDSNHQVLLVLPTPDSDESALAWQALDHMSFDQVGGTGPEANPMREPAERGAVTLLDSFSFARPIITPAAIHETRSAFEHWGVTTAVVVPVHGWIFSLPASVAFLTLVIGHPPLFEDRAYVWSHVDRSGPSVIESTATVERCLRDLGTVSSIDTCVLGHRSP